MSVSFKYFSDSILLYIVLLYRYCVWQWCN